MAGRDGNSSKRNPIDKQDNQSKDICLHWMVMLTVLYFRNLP